MVREKLRQGTLFQIHLTEEPPVRSTYVVTSKAVPPGLAARSFVEGFLLPLHP
jgi:hypothetical protein